MLTPYYSEPDAQAHAAAGRRADFHTLSSKMFDTYLTDIEQLLQHQMWSAALTDALALPHLGAALGNVEQRSSGSDFKTWCAAWIRPDPQPNAQSLVDGERLFRMWCERAGCPEADASLSVPVRALRQLRLRRLARPMSPGCRPLQPKTNDADAAQAVQVCTLLLDAARRWYTRRAARDDTVQANLARLAVMR